MKYKTVRAYGDHLIDKVVEDEGRYGYKPIFITPVVVPMKNEDGEDTFPMISFYITFERIQ